MQSRITFIEKYSNFAIFYYQYKDIKSSLLRYSTRQNEADFLKPILPHFTRSQTEQKGTLGIHPYDSGIKMLVSCRVIIGKITFLAIETLHISFPYHGSHLLVVTQGFIERMNMSGHYLQDVHGVGLDAQHLQGHGIGRIANPCRSAI